MFEWADVIGRNDEKKRPDPPYIERAPRQQPDLAEANPGTTGLTSASLLMDTCMSTTAIVARC
jgi:hypothetical protein